MHYYQFNIGDYHSHTAHLEPMEDIAYRRMMDFCYLNEIPLPPTVEEIARLIRMRSHTDCIAVVLSEFFTEVDNGYIQPRINDEVAKYREKSAKAKKSAEARWGSKDKGSGDANALRTESEGNAKHKPLNTKHKPLNKYSSADYSLAVAMHELIIYVAPHTKKPNFESWANIIRLMREVDKIPLDTIQQVFNWANSDDFWKTNILSASKLRKQFNQLQAKMVNTNENNQRPNQSGRSSVVSRVHAAANEREQARRVEERALDGQAMGETPGSLRSPTEQPIRGDDTAELGRVIDGDYSRAD